MISQDAASQLALKEVPGTITATNVTNRAGETFYTFDVQSAQGAQRVTVDATHGKVMAVIPLTQ